MFINPDSLIFSRLSDSSDVSSFACSQYKDLEEFLKNDAKNYLREKIAITYLVHSDGKLVGFFSVAMGCISSETIKVHRGVIQAIPNKYPAHLLIRIATQDGLRGMGIGREMLTRVFALTFRVCPYIGCRFIKVDAKKDPKTIHFYERYGGFVKISENSDTVQMVVDINKLCAPDTSVGKRLSDFQ